MEPTRYISDLYNSELKPVLFELLFKFLRKLGKNSKKLETILSKPTTDENYLKIFMNLVYRNTGKEKINNSRGLKRAGEIRKILSEYQNIDYKKKVIEAAKNGKYLDLGSNDCTITRLIGRGFGFGKENIYAVDVDDYSRNAKVQQINFTKIDGKHLPFPDDEFIFVTSLQVLHHMNSLSDMLFELVRVMQDGGIFVIREQNSVSDDDEKHDLYSKLFDIEHMMYDVVLDPKSDYETFMTNYYSSFRSKLGWKKLLNNFGFEQVRVGNITTFNPTNYYYAAYMLKKPAKLPLLCGSFEKKEGKILSKASNKKWVALIGEEENLSIGYADGKPYIAETAPNSLETLKKSGYLYTVVSENFEPDEKNDMFFISEQEAEILISEPIESLFDELVGLDVMIITYENYEKFAKDHNL